MEPGGKDSFQAVKLQRPARATVCSHSKRDMAAMCSMESKHDNNDTQDECLSSCVQLLSGGENERAERSSCRAVALRLELQRNKVSSVQISINVAVAAQFFYEQVPSRGMALVDLFSLGVSSWVLGTNVEFKFFVPLRRKVHLHFVHSVANGRSGRDEHPRAVGAAPTFNTLYLNHFTGHAEL
jgi:hypothetical protein